MRYYGPRQRKIDEKWDYTYMLDDNVFATGYCVGWDEEIGVVDLDLRKLIEESIEEKRPFKDKYHCDGHLTPDGAKECYREYLIDQKLKWRHDKGVQRQCDVDGCGEWTHHYAEAESVMIRLCEKHKTEEIIRKIFPMPGDAWVS